LNLAKYLGEGTSRERAEEKSSALFILDVLGKGNNEFRGPGIGCHNELWARQICLAGDGNWKLRRILKNWAQFLSY
jgi:hypothetical protein